MSQAGPASRRTSLRSLETTPLVAIGPGNWGLTTQVSAPIPPVADAGAIGEDASTRAVASVFRGAASESGRPPIPTATHKESVSMRHASVHALAIVATALVAAPAPAQTMLDKLVQRIGRPKNANTDGVPTGAPGAALAQLSPEQGAAIDRLLAAPVQDTAVAAARADAAPLIRALVATGACARMSDAWNALNGDALTPRTYHEPFSGELVAMNSLQYHDKRRCLDVARITDWSRPAANALRFRAYYFAADSSEAKGQTFEVQRQDGRWMLRLIGSALS